MRNVITLVLLLSALAVTACNNPSRPAPVVPSAPKLTTVFILRHAEKTADGDNPPLTEAGMRRAQFLVRAVEDANVQAIYTTQFKRNRDTAQPLADRLGIPVTEVPINLSSPGDYGKQLAKEILEKHSGETVVVVSHITIIPTLIESLSGKAIDPIRDPDYDNLFIVTIPASEPASLVKAQYGLPPKSGGEMMMQPGK
jgi:broad specificity phosphatase PhoE